jgi:hypothetical protein
MADRNVLTAPVSVCFDPETHPAPRGVTLWVVGPGGSGYKGHWYEGAIAWAYLPQLPESVKARQDQRTKQQQENERNRDQHHHSELPEEQVR